MLIHIKANAVRRAAQAATWSGAPDGVGTVSNRRVAVAGLSDATVRSNRYSSTQGSCLKNPAVDLANVPANRPPTTKVIPTRFPGPLAGTFAGHRFRST